MQVFSLYFRENISLRSQTNDISLIISYRMNIENKKVGIFTLC